MYFHEPHLQAEKTVPGNSQHDLACVRQQDQRLWCWRRLLLCHHLSSFVSFLLTSLQSNEPHLKAKGTYSVILLARGNKAGDNGAGGDSFWWRCTRLRFNICVRSPTTTIVIIAAEVALGCPHVRIPRPLIITLPKTPPSVYQHLKYGAKRYAPQHR